MQQLQSAHYQEINNMKAITNDIARKTDIENMEFRAAQDIAQAAVDKTKAEIQQNVQQALQPLQEYTQKTQSMIDLQQQ